MKRSGLPALHYARRKTHLAEAYREIPAEVFTRCNSSDIAPSHKAEPPFFFQADGRPGVLRLASALAQAVTLHEKNAPIHAISIIQRPSTIGDAGSSRENDARYSTRNARLGSAATPEWIIHSAPDNKN